MVTLMLLAVVGCGGKESDDVSGEAQGGESNLLIVTSDAVFDESVVRAERPVLVDFWAPWCPPCRAMDPIIKKAAVQYQGQVDIAKLNVDDNRALAERFNIRAIPTFMIFYKGKAIAMYEGAMRSKELDAWIREQLKQAGVEWTQPAI